MTDTLDKRYQTLIVLWFAMLMNILVLFMVAIFAVPEDPQPDSRSWTSFLIAAVGMFSVVLSFAVKRKLLERSVANQDVTLVQKAMVISCAMCEAAALLGLLGRFILGNNDYYLMFLIAAFGIALHFPRRAQLEAATYKTSGTNLS